MEDDTLSKKAVANINTQAGSVGSSNGSRGPMQASQEPQCCAAVTPGPEFSGLRQRPDGVLTLCHQFGKCSWWWRQQFSKGSGWLQQPILFTSGGLSFQERQSMTIGTNVQRVQYDLLSGTILNPRMSMSHEGSPKNDSPTVSTGRRLRRMLKLGAMLLPSFAGYNSCTSYTQAGQMAVTENITVAISCH